ncbi:thioredoxin-like protein [Fragilariopsis cylindrus CCMP1102]|uniref:Thioredoxin-like protein n=1 Tax=Fragilariopsis cylindrus CCMP1102 TaxID=635003 RepID=A0A1E7F900_9STRA|nr:thioredoxin-like protein [Fragilariopsis cylindrus CCMP1102]|eukprot:OEU14648.1 thioredoxin-like protein [Fragilariopsis cylindrus CCMP1102]
MSSMQQQEQEQAVVYCSNEQEYFQAIESAGPHKLVVVDCYAEWCPPCKQIAPVFDALARENSQTTNDIVFVKVDVDKVPTIKSILGVWAMPSFFFLKDGNKVGSFMGANENLLRKGIANDGYVEKWLELKRYLDVLIGKNKVEKKFKQAKAMGAADKSNIELWPVATVFRYTYG